MLKTIRDFFAAMAASSSVDEFYINKLFMWFLILSIIIYLVVLAGTLTGAIRFHWKKRPQEPEQISGKKWIEITWTVIPLLILVVFFYFMVDIMKKIEQPYGSEQKPDIVIVAHQWWWEMRYPDSRFATANELHIPVRKKMLIRVESADVIHDWWVPALGRKIDAIPGKPNYSWLEALEMGEFKGTCSEYCGEQHAWMRILVVSQSEQEFNRWVAAQQVIPPVPDDSLSLSGLNLFINKTCIRCHSIAGTPGTATIGPDLTHVNQRKTLLSGMLENTPENMYRWLKNPQKIKQGAYMPDFLLNNHELKALSHYLENL